MTVDVAKLRALCDATPSGKWCARETYVYRTDDPRDHRQVARVPDVARPGHVHPNAAFIAAARTALPDCLDEIAQLRAALTEALDIATAGGRRDGRSNADEQQLIAELRKLVQP